MTTIPKARTEADAFADGAAAADLFVDDYMTWAAGRRSKLDPTPDSEPDQPRSPYTGRLGRAWRDGWADYMTNHAPPAPRP